MEESALDCSFVVFNGQVMAEVMGEDEISQGENITYVSHTKEPQRGTHSPQELGNREILPLF